MSRSDTETLKISKGFAKVQSYVALTKPRVIELLLVTAVPVMILAGRELPHLALLAATIIGGALSAGSANAFNMFIDRDIDTHMNRTQSRPMVTGAISGRSAIVFATSLGIASFVCLWFFTTPLAAALAVGAILFYVFVYSLWLKRRSEQNIIWGGIAGCFPVLIGWSAVTGSLGPEPIVLFLIVFLWTPPHYWPLSMRYREDYARVSVPMLAVVRESKEVGTQVILYAWATVAASLLLIPVAAMGLVYWVVAVPAGALFLVESHLLYRRTVSGGETSPMRVFRSSITYLTVLFLAVGVDPLVPA